MVWASHAGRCRRLNDRDASSLEGRESTEDDNGTNDRVPTVCRTLYLELYRHLMRFSPQLSIGATINCIS